MTGSVSIDKLNGFSGFGGIFKFVMLSDSNNKNENNFCINGNENIHNNNQTINFVNNVINNYKIN